ncbi:MAG: redoxin family protein [Candidatus Acidiferrales bacterium]
MTFRRLIVPLLFLAVALLFGRPAFASAFVSPQASQGSPQKKSQTAKSPPSDESQSADPEVELEHAIDDAGNDRAAVVRNLEDYLKRFPNAPRQVAVFRALVEACEQIHDDAKALDYAERLIAISPNDTDMLLHAAGLLETSGDDPSLTRGEGYLTRVIDRVEKTPATEKPPRLSESEWKDQQAHTLMALYLMRGRIASKLHDVQAARKNFETSFELVPNAPAAERLGEIAEDRHDLSGALENYLQAFILPESVPGGSVDRAEVRKKLGNVWRLLHNGSETGLGDAVLAAYDHNQQNRKPEEPSGRNKDAKAPLEFVVRGLDNSAVPMSSYAGKIVVIDFWATWCGPCRELEPLIAGVAKAFGEQKDVVFLAVNTDEDQDRVPPFVKREKIAFPVLYADGLDDFLGVRSLPTVVILDRNGKIASKMEGFDPSTFASQLTDAVNKVLTPVAVSPASSP